jgi:hypothetical protein
MDFLKALLLGFLILLLIFIMAGGIVFCMDAINTPSNKEKLQAITSQKEQIKFKNNQILLRSKIDRTNFDIIIPGTMSDWRAKGKPLDYGK